jgi:hypothetical protein
MSGIKLFPVGSDIRCINENIMAEIAADAAEWIVNRCLRPD